MCFICAKSIRTSYQLFFIYLKAQLFVFLDLCLFLNYILTLSLSLLYQTSFIWKLKSVGFVCMCSIIFVLSLCKISQSILPNFFISVKAQLFVSPPADYYLPFCALFSEAPYYYLRFCSQPSPRKSFHNTEMGLMGFLRIEYGDSALLCGYFESGGPVVIFTIGKVVHNGQLGLVWLIHWNWDHF